MRTQGKGLKSANSENQGNRVVFYILGDYVTDTRKIKKIMLLGLHFSQVIELPH
jgi:hypothetical protein